MTTPLIETKNLKKYFRVPQGNLHAVDDISLTIDKGQTLGVVGESGCGKSTLGRTILRLLPATEGDILYDGKSVLSLNNKEMNQMRRKMQIIFQDPYASLNPRMTVGQIIAEPIIVQGIIKNREAVDQRVQELMELVGLAYRLVNSYPHELDGGRRQRIGIARALSLDPSFIVCDEPVSALDVSIQAQILNLMMDLQDDLGLAYMFITHNLSVVKHISKNIMVMYLGQCVERAPADELFANPLHPYTRILLDAIPKMDLSFRNKKQNIIRGEVTNPINPEPGCRFAARCPFAKPECTSKDIAMKDIGNSHEVSCILY